MKIMLYSGKLFDISNFTEDEIDIEDIAHALSMTCRFGGHIDAFYSVAEHCCLLSDYFLNQWDCPRDAKQALLHDAAEAYVGDHLKPIKDVLKVEYLEGPIYITIARRFGIEEEVNNYVKEADKRILITEMKDLNPRFDVDDWIQGVRPLPVEIRRWTPDQAKREFLWRFEDLFGEKNG